MEHNTLFFLRNEREFNIETKEFLEISRTVIFFFFFWNAIFFSVRMKDETIGRKFFFFYFNFCYYFVLRTNFKSYFELIILVRLARDLLIFDHTRNRDIRLTTRKYVMKCGNLARPEP